MDPYKKLQRYLESFLPPPSKKYPREFGLLRMKEWLRVLGNPHTKYKTIHIVGTSGKGSTATLLSHILTTAGYKTGLTISPHLQSMTERIQINDEPIHLSALITLVEGLTGPLKQMEEGAYGLPSYYEILLGLAFLHFAKEKVGVAVVEAGLGGQFDGTNVITPLAGIVTTIGLDHMDVLGDTIEKIAKDKLGIIKPKMDVIIGASQPSVQEIAAIAAEAAGDPCLRIGKEFSYTVTEQTFRGSSFDLTLNGKTLSNLFVSLAGAHQVHNAALATVCALRLEKKGFSVGERVIRRALKTAFVPGRFELVEQFPKVVIDGAHNPDKIAALLETLKLYPTKRWYVVFAAKNDKNVKDMLALLYPRSSFIVATEFNQTTDVGKRMAMSVEEIRAIGRSLKSRQTRAKAKTFMITDPLEALQKAKEAAGSEGSVLVTGSLYLVGELRNHWYPVDYSVKK